MALDIQSIMDALGKLGSWGSGNDASNPSAAFTTPQSTEVWSPTSVAAPSFGTMAGNSLTDGSAANVAGAAGSGFGMNLGTAQLGLGGLAAIGSIFNGLQANKLAKDQFKFTKDITNTNLNNQIQSYNTALSDRINSRTYTQGQDQSVADDYLAKNRLSR